MRNHTCNETRRIAGFSLIELMISMLLGLMLVGVAVTTFQGQSRSADLGQAIVELQGRARFALDQLSMAVRSAGYVGCAGMSGTVPALPQSITESATPRTGWRPIAGYLVAAGGWLPDAPEGYGAGGYVPPASGVASPIAGSDALLIEGGTGQGSAIGTGASTASTLPLTDPVPALVRSAMGLAGDCMNVEVFFVDAQVAHADGSATITTHRPRAFARALNPDFPLGGRVMPYRRALYFVGDTGRVTEFGEPIRALYEHLHPFQETQPQELANGVEALVLRYRQRSAAGTIRELSAADAGFDPARVLAVRMGLVLSSGAYRVSADAAQEFVLSGVTVGTTAPGPAHPDDLRIRRSFERTAGVRARSEALMP